MKIGIISYYRAHNHGAMLQAFALQHELRQMGHDPCHIHVRPDDDNFEARFRSKLKNARDPVQKTALFFMKRRLARRFDHFEEFLQSQIRLSPRYQSVEMLFENPPRMDLYICGSDQIWNLQCGIGRQFFGAFVPDGLPLISYAPSFGNSEIPTVFREDLRELLGRFAHLSVREECGRLLVEELTGKEVTRVIDPVFLVENEVWDRLERGPALKQPYIAFYSLENSARTSEIVTSLSKSLRMPVVVLGKAGLFALTCRTVNSIDAGPRDFLGWIRHAALVLTNSFHATAFAVKYNVPFITIAHTHRNARMEDLLSSLGLSDRIIHDAGQVQRMGALEILSKPPIDVTGKIDRQVDASRVYLRQAVSHVGLKSTITNENAPDSLNQNGLM